MIAAELLRSLNSLVNPTVYQRRESEVFRVDYYRRRTKNWHAINCCPFFGAPRTQRDCYLFVEFAGNSHQTIIARRYSARGFGSRFGIDAAKNFAHCVPHSGIETICAA